VLSWKMQGGRLRELEMMALSGRVMTMLSVAMETSSRLLETLKNGLWLRC
jgi:hypothetical protein